MEIESSIIEVINLLDLIIVKQDSKVYNDLKENYLNALKQVQMNSPNSKVLSNIRLITRRLMESPPKDREIGMTLLVAMDKVHKQLI